MLAARQHGNITRTQLVGLGVRDTGIAHRVRHGRLHRVHHGVHSVGRPARTAIERAAAAVLACGPGAVLSFLSALVLWGIVKRWPPLFDVSVPGDRRVRGIRIHRCPGLTRRDIRTHLGIRRYRFHSDRESFEKDRNRDTDTLAAGFPTVRITWRRVTQEPDKEAARLGAILRARRRP